MATTDAKGRRRRPPASSASQTTSKKQTSVRRVPSLSAAIPPERLLTLPELCQFVQMGRTKVLTLIHQEGLPVYRVGSAFRFDRMEVWLWLQWHHSEHHDQERRASAHR